ncbi:RNA polymerase subunit sigma-70 [Marivirga lumbricoides]|uniref:RNA polymerase sigma factor n=1 Tax=Marivirga lumbricoides TaxID=1046115 RepID=A0A2T4DRK2_9BACT|nr:RNA polymerase subunit sigma-70 [Marivirga lumbricoides]
MNKSSSDIELVKKAIEGDASAFRQLVEEYKDVSLSLTCSIIKDYDAAQDVLQDAFVKVYNKLHQFSGKAAFSTWLYRIVVNTAFSALRKHQYFTQIEEVDEIYHQPDSKEDNFMKAADQEKFVKVALDRLKPEEALVLRLYYLCEFSIAETKKVTGFSESKIKVNLHRGRKNMHEQLTRILGEDIKQLL